MPVGCRCATPLNRRWPPSTAPSSTQEKRQLARLRQQLPVLAPELPVFLKEATASETGAEGSQVGVLGGGAGFGQGGTEVHGVVDRRRRHRPLESDERRREPGVEDRRGQRRVEQARL